MSELDFFARVSWGDIGTMVNIFSGRYEDKYITYQTEDELKDAINKYITIVDEDFTYDVICDLFSVINDEYNKYRTHDDRNIIILVFDNKPSIYGGKKGASDIARLHVFNEVTKYYSRKYIKTLKDELEEDNVF